MDRRHARLVTPGDVEALAAALLQAVELDRDAVRAHAVATCSVEAMVDGYEVLYGDCATDPSAERAA